MEKVNKTIKFIFIVVCIIILCCITVISASDGIKNDDNYYIGISNLSIDSYDDINYQFISPEFAKDIAKSRIEAIYNCNVEIVRGDPIYDLDENLFGYEITFETDVYSDKIVILDTNNSDSLVYQFTLYTPKDNLSLVNDSNMDNISISNIVKKYIVSPFTIGELIDKSNLQIGEQSVNLKSLKIDINRYLPKTYNNAQSEVIKNDYKDDKYFKEWYNSSKKIKIKEKYITNAKTFKPENQNKLHYKASNCGATAAYNILKYYNDCLGYDIFKEQSINTVYQKVIHYMGGEESTTIYQMAEGVKDYINLETSKSASFTHYVPPMWSYFKGDLDNNNPVIYTVIVKEGPHAMGAFGYLEINEDKLIGGKKFKFLIVASGETNYLKFTNFEAVDWRLGCVIKVK